MTSLSVLSVDELVDGICVRAGRISTAQAELLVWIAEFDRREGWAGPGLLSCAHWLSWRVGMSPGTARGQVRVARRLEDLPQVAAAFADGRVSYSKVRAITRVAEPDDGIDGVDLARHASAAQLDKIVRGVHRARANEQAERDPEAAGWRLRTRTRYDEQGNFVLTITGPAELLPVVRAGLDAKKAQLQQERDARADQQDGDLPPPATPPAPPTVAPAPVPPPAAAAEPTSRGTGEAGTPVDDESPMHESSDDESSLDEQAPGWPAGTTGRQVQEAMRSFATLQASLRAEQAELDDDAPFPAPVPAPAAAAADRPTPPPRPVPTPPPVSAAGPSSGDAGGAGAGATEPVPVLDAVTDADALLALAQDALQAESSARPDLARRRRPQLTARIDPLSGWARQADGELLPPSSLRQVMRTLPGRDGVLRLRPVTEADLRRCDLGRTSRQVNPALRELLGALDGERCRLPGCTRTTQLHAHHVVYWSEGGQTDLANLVLVCARHHTLLHAQGFQLTVHPDRRLEVHTADGVPVLHQPAQPWGTPPRSPHPVDNSFPRKHSQPTTAKADSTCATPSAS